MTTLLAAHFGWRGACLTWATLHLVLGLPLNRLVVPPTPPPEKLAASVNGEEPHPASMLIAWVFAATLFVSAATATHLPWLLQAMGATPVVAVAAASLIGPAQLGARLVE